MKRLLPLLLLISSIATINAQTPNQYVFEKTSADYKELVNEKPIVGAYVDPAGVWKFDIIGDKFQMFDMEFDIDNTNQYLEFSNNGFLRFVNDTTLIVIDALFTSSDSIDNKTSLSYTIDGNPGNRRIKIQWKNLALANGQAGNYVNYQIWYHQLTGIIEIHYGPSDKNSSGFNTTNGPNVGLFYARKDFTIMHEKIWVNGSVDNYTLDSARTVSFRALRGVPKEGTIFRFVPRKYLLSIASNNSSDDVLVYPNPTTDNITVQLKDNTASTKASLYDLNGRLINTYEIPATTNTYSIPVNHVSNGMYELTLQNRNHQSTHKIEVKH